MKWLLKEGGLAAIDARNARKADKLYAEIDRTGYYRGHAHKDSRSRMNVTFRLPSEELEKKFAKEATAAGLDGLKGHRSVGGLRASIYNAFPEAGVDALVAFMKEFERVERLSSNWAVSSASRWLISLERMSLLREYRSLTFGRLVSCYCDVASQSDEESR